MGTNDTLILSQGQKFNARRSNHIQNAGNLPEAVNKK